MQAFAYMVYLSDTPVAESPGLCFCRDAWDALETALDMVEAYGRNASVSPVSAYEASLVGRAWCARNGYN